MNYNNLHTHVLERLFGNITLEIVKQDDTIRIIHLRDNDNISRTLGIVRFLNVKGDLLKKAHHEILNGALMGKTLFDAHIDFDKEFMGSIQVRLPSWLQSEFKTHAKTSLGFVSRIHINSNVSSEAKFLYSELIEIIPPELIDAFENKWTPLMQPDVDIASLMEEADIETIKIKN